MVDRDSSIVRTPWLPVCDQLPVVVNSGIRRHSSQLCARCLTLHECWSNFLPLLFPPALSHKPPRSTYNPRTRAAKHLPAARAL